MSAQRSRGLPKALEEEEEREAFAKENPIGEFLEGMFGAGAAAQNQDGLPTLDWLKSKFKTKSAAIRYLINQGHAVKVIAKHLGIKYQHARNVATQQLKRGPNESWKLEPEATPETPETPEQQQQQQPTSTFISNSVIPCYKGVACNWPACPPECVGRPGRMLAPPPEEDTDDDGED